MRKLFRKIGMASPPLYFLLQYERAARKLKCERSTRDDAFARFLAACEEKPSLQIGVKDDIGKKFGPNWVSVDKYDTRDFIDFQYDIHDLQFEDNRFDGAACISILEHIPYPQRAIGELRRVLKPGGLIWVQLPFQFPYHEAPKDYWRVSPDGLRVWMEGFEEVACGAYLWSKTSLVMASYFCGLKK